MENRITQSLKQNPEGKAIISLVLGVVSMIVGWIWILPSSLLQILVGTSGTLSVYFVISFLIPFSGVILGMIGLKSTKKSLAIIGIVLCAIGLLSTLFFFFFMQVMAAGM
ncbi:hypothetical protein ACFL11_00170 [Patescibacteria group bacterium]